MQSIVRDCSLRRWTCPFKVLGLAACREGPAARRSAITEFRKFLWEESHGRPSCRRRLEWHACRPSCYGLPRPACSFQRAGGASPSGCTSGKSRGSQRRAPSWAVGHKQRIAAGNAAQDPADGSLGCSSCPACCWLEREELGQLTQWIGLSPDCARSSGCSHHVRQAQQLWSCGSSSSTLL